MRRQQNGFQAQSYGQQLAEIHANAVPGATRDEESEELLPAREMNRSPAQQALRRNYNDLERSRERERYEEYLDERDSEKLPNAFDLGWKTNLRHLFGEKPLLWLLPVCNSVGDGWHWEPSPKWLEAREELKRQREAQLDQQQRPERYDSHHAPEYWSDSIDTSRASIPPNGQPKEYFERHYDNDSASSRMSLKTLRRRESFEEGDDVEDGNDYDLSSDEEAPNLSRPSDGWYAFSEPNGHGKEGHEWKKLE